METTSKEFICITGAAGYIGRNLIKHLLENTEEHLLLLDTSGDKNTGDLPEFKNLTYNYPDRTAIVWGDISNYGPGDMHFLMNTKIKEIYNLVQSFKVVENMLELAYHHDIKILNLTSSYSKDINDLIERYKEKNVLIKQCKYSEVYGPDKNNKGYVSDIIFKALNNYPISINKEKKSFCFISDLIEMLVYTMSSNKKYENYMEIEQVEAHVLVDKIKKIVKSKSSVSYEEIDFLDEEEYKNFFRYDLKIKLDEGLEAIIGGK